MNTEGTNPPSNGHLIVFYKIKLSQKSEDIKLQIDPEEVNALCWITRDNIKKIFNYENGANDAIFPAKLNQEKKATGSSVELK